MRILFLSLLVFLALPFSGNSQSLKQVLEAGDESFQNRDYYNAYRCYETVLSYASKGAYKGDTLKVKFSYAQAAQRLNYFSKARDLYSELGREAKDVDKNIYARALFNQAKMLQNLAQDNPSNYSLALDIYQLFISEGLFRDIEGEAKVKERFKQAAESGIISCDSLRNAPVVRTDSLYRLARGINSGYSDLAPVRIGDTLYFSSLRFLPKGFKNPSQPQFYSKNMMAEFVEGIDPVSSVELTDTFVTVLPEQGIYNADKVHTLHTAFSQDGSLKFFTQCMQEGEDFNCWLYMRRRLSDGSWGMPQKLSVSAENNEFTTTQPSISFDCATGREWLYFSSDRPGTQGGLDIWRAEVREDATLGDPENLSAINTKWHEATPFFHDPSQRLYFSSDAPPSFGEYDIFYSQYQDGSWSVPENMGSPYNSGYNDEYFFLTADGKHEYFASDRPRSFRFVEELEFCCTDIYTMGNKVDRSIEVSLEDCDENNPIEKVVELYELSCGQRSLVGEPKTINGRGNASFTVQLHHSYEVVARSVASNLSRSKQFDLSEDQYLNEEKKIVWKPEPFYPAWLDMKVIAYDLSSDRILTGASVTVTVAESGAPVGAGQGNNVFRIEPNVNYKISLVADASQSGPDYGMQDQSTRPPAKAQAYLPVDTAFSYTLSDTENMLRLCGKVELKIGMKAQTPELPLPIVLYFDHDMPLRFNRRADQTRQGFDDAISRYLENRDDFLKNNDPSEERKVNAFFDREVSGGLSTLDNLAKSLLEYVDYMGEDEQLVIEIQGYCSPRGNDIYNRLLSKRRIQCIRTYLESYTQDGRVLKDYIGDKYIVRELPLGESRAGSTYPDNDPNSIWGIGPALDRRVEIVDLSKGDAITGSPDPTETITQEQEP
ncbi:MAG: PD40 domain-containing protein [Lewinellaceae bacterium]|nr:PD40 domain-containing protein [Phaeodactylibacter sp.]MCB0613224.1 PD40 domain-containing protein [Phaeodactylibacter sp.]MCB9347030.1 PD40 domain-containing protein [Lewinellaceae bacterium]